MKLINLTLAFLLFSNIIFAQYTLIPDVNFENALISLGYDSGTPDGKVLTANINKITYLYVIGKNISNLTGIEDFVALKTLSCFSNNLISINISNNKSLVNLYCGDNKLTSLDVSNNILLQYINCDFNYISNLDVSNLKLLSWLEFADNNIKNIDVSNNPLLTYLYCGGNNLINLDVSNNILLTYLNCSYCKLTSLDVSKNSKLIKLYCKNTTLKNLNIRNNNNLNMTTCIINNNPNLYCVTVDDPWFSYTNWAYKQYYFEKDDWTQYTDEICGTNLISGNAFYDANLNCTKEISEKVLPKIIIKAEGDNDFYSTTDNSGNYRILVDSNKTYNVNAVTFSDLKLMKSSCPDSGFVVNSGVGGTITSNKNFALDIKQCTMLSVEISKSRMRRCFKNNTNILYKNEGTIDESNAKIFVDYPEYIKIVSADKSYSLFDAEKNIYVFDIGTITAFGSGTINIVDSVVCGNESIRGLTQCVKAWITPKSYCAETKDTTAWDKSSIQVLDAKCINGIAHFVILNHGSGDMNSQHEYRFYYDNELAYTGSFQLNSGDSLVLDVTADGSTIRLEADQHPLHPGHGRPRTTLEACGAETPDKVSFNFWTQTENDDLDFDIAEVCLEILDSYDPNDKKVLPAGITAEHFVSETGELKYTIRFQNTGSAAAIKIMVVDSLSESLDISTLNILGASHIYDYNVSGTNRKVLTFTFNNINLPDSTTNEAASHGFVSFSIAPIQGIAKGTKIENFADIYFDYNSAVRTDTAWVTALDTVITSSKIITVTEQSTLGISETKLSNIKIYPNPTNEFLFIKNANSEFSKIEIFDIKGSLILTENLNSNEQKINVNSFQKGIYFIHLSNENGEMKTFKMVK